MKVAEAYAALAKTFPHRTFVISSDCWYRGARPGNPDISYRITVFDPEGKECIGVGDVQSRDLGVVLAKALEIRFSEDDVPMNTGAFDAAGIA